MITQERLKQLFYYKNGRLYWRELKGSRRVNPAGCNDGHGYKAIRIGKRTYKAHRLIFMFHHGYWPECVDHINRDRSDDRIENLREATRAQNNTHRSESRTKKYRGVREVRNSGKYAARINFSHKEYHLGVFETEEEAAIVYNKKAIELHGEFAVLNKLPD